MTSYRPTIRRSQAPFALAVYREGSRRAASQVGGGSAGPLGGFDAHFMKTSLILVLASVFVGCESSRQSASLTADQAKTLAMRLANDNVATLYHSRPFVAGQPAQFVAGHWLWVAQQGFGHGDIEATVELAANGSTNSVDIQVLSSQNPVLNTPIAHPTIIKP